jgi:hypothetical protein
MQIFTYTWMHASIESGKSLVFLACKYNRKYINVKMCRFKTISVKNLFYAAVLACKKN